MYSDLLIDSESLTNSNIQDDWYLSTFWFVLISRVKAVTRLPLFLNKILDITDITPILLAY